MQTNSAQVLILKYRLLSTVILVKVFWTYNLNPLIFREGKVVCVTRHNAIGLGKAVVNDLMRVALPD